MNFKTRLIAGLEFQDFIVIELYKFGLPTMAFTSEKYQHMYGESIANIEIKNDRNFRRTRNLFIEIEERRDCGGMWRPAGIFDDHNPWLLVIGDFKNAWIFSVRQLRQKVKHFELKVTETSKGIIIPLFEANELCIEYLCFPIKSRL